MVVSLSLSLSLRHDALYIMSSPRVPRLSRIGSITSEKHRQTLFAELKQNGECCLVFFRK